MPTKKTSCLTPAAFLKLPRAKKAMLVAEDVLAQVRGENYLIKNQVYLDFAYDEFRGKEDLSTASPEGSKAILDAKCECCARGALFLSSIRLSNRMSIKELVDLENLKNTDDAEDNWLKTMAKTSNGLASKVCDKDGIFSKNNFTLIEVAFEGDIMPYVNSNSRPSAVNIEAAKNFHKTFRGCDLADWEDLDSNTLISAICLNIIANKGTFNPKKNIPTVEEAQKAVQVEVAS